MKKVISTQKQVEISTTMELRRIATEVGRIAMEVGRITTELIRITTRPGE